MKRKFISDFIPKPNINFNILPKNNGFKVKCYLQMDVVKCIRTEFEHLYEQQYTHVVNMPGNLHQIICAAKHYNIICLDSRLTKHIADFCSKVLVSEKQKAKI